MKNSLCLTKRNILYNVLQQFHNQVYTQRTESRTSDRYSCQCPLQHYSQLSKRRNNASVHRQMNGQTDPCTMYAMKYSVQFNRSVVSDSLRLHESQHARPTCPAPTPKVHPDSRPSSHWCHPAISSSVVPFSSCPQSSQHQSLFQWVNSSHEVAKVLEFQL